MRRLIFFPLLATVCAIAVFAVDAQDEGTDGVAAERENALAAYNRAQHQEANGLSAAAIADYATAERLAIEDVERHDVNNDTYAVLTWSLFKQKKYNEVIKWGTRALAIKRDMRVIETIGDAYFYLENYALSLKSMSRYVAYYPKGERSATAFFYIGEIYRIEQRFHYADIAYTTAVSLEAGMSLWWYRLGTVREALGDKEYAAEAFNRALRIRPHYDDAAAGLQRVEAEE
jgi:tetratricopeptide (TPR) repeat protein